MQLSVALDEQSHADNWCPFQKSKWAQVMQHAWTRAGERRNLVGDENLLLLPSSYLFLLFSSSCSLH